MVEHRIPHQNTHPHTYARFCVYTLNKPTYVGQKKQKAWWRQFSREKGEKRKRDDGRDDGHDKMK